MVGQLLIRRATIGSLVFAAYGLGEAYARLPEQLSPGTLILSSLWAVALFAATGLLAAGALTIVSASLSLPMPMSRRASTAALLETILWLPLILWLVLNEVVYSTTSEVVGYDSILMAWHNPGATFQNAWQMGGRYLVGVAIATLALTAVLYGLSRRSFRAVWPSRGRDLSRRGFHRIRSRPRPFRLAFPMTGGLALLAALLTWQIHTRPGVALTTLFRSAPPLKALNLTRALIGDDLRAGESAPTGAAIVTDSTYAATAGRARESAPNIILILLESVSARALHCYGYPREDVSPNMDALANAGVLFEHCWSGASFSSYGLLSTMTSLYLLREEVNDHFDDHDFPQMSIPRALKLGGYETAIFSSGNESFDHINDFCRPSDFDRYYTQDTSGIEHPDCMRMDDHFAIEEFQKWMARRSGSRPFYASFYLQSTHFDYGVPKPWSEHYQPTPPLLGNGNAIIKIPPDLLPPLRNQYDNAMRYSDYWVGQIVATLKKANAFDNSVIAIIGDHGEAFMEHGLARHGVHLWEEMLHIPLIVYVGPTLRANLGHEPPSRVPDTVSGIDVAPTLTALAGLHPHPSWQGVNILSPNYTSRDRPIYAVLQLTRRQQAVTVNKLKYIYDLSNVEEYLFDLAEDPGEKQNLAETRLDWRDPMHELLRIWNMHQLSYYAPAHRPFTRYIGLPQVPASTLAALHRGPTTQPVRTAQLQ